MNKREEGAKRLVAGEEAIKLLRRYADMCGNLYTAVNPGDEWSAEVEKLLNDLGKKSKLEIKRKELGLTVMALAKKSGVNKAIISRIERGEGANTGMQSAIKIAQALGCTVEQIAGEA